MAEILPIGRKTLSNQLIISKTPSKCGQGIHTYKPITQSAAAWAWHSYTSNCQSMADNVGGAFILINLSINGQQCGWGIHTHRPVNQWATEWGQHSCTIIQLSIN